MNYSYIALIMYYTIFCITMILCRKAFEHASTRKEQVKIFALFFVMFVATTLLGAMSKVDGYFTCQKDFARTLNLDCNQTASEDDKYFMKQDIDDVLKLELKLTEWIEISK